MRNFRHWGKNVKVTIPSGSIVTAGKEAKISQVIGIPANHGIAGMTVDFAIEGVWGLTFTGQGTIGVGSYLYYDYGLNLLSLGRGGTDDIPFGQVVEVLDSTNKVMAVKLMICPPTNPLYA